MNPIIAIIIDSVIDLTDSTHSYIFRKRTHSIHLSSQMEIISSENHARTATYVAQRFCTLLDLDMLHCVHGCQQISNEMHLSSGLQSAVLRLHRTLLRYMWCVLSPWLILRLFISISLCTAPREMSLARMAPYFLRIKFSWYTLTVMYMTAKANPIPNQQIKQDSYLNVCKHNVR